jgi:hypothetical protein
MPDNCPIPGVMHAVETCLRFESTMARDPHEEVTLANGALIIQRRRREHELACPACLILEQAEEAKN